MKIAEMRSMPIAACVLATTLLAACAANRSIQDDPLPSWNETAARARIIEFVTAVSKPGNTGFVPVAERIAVFDNDGTLWSEQPIYFQLAFAFDRIRALAPQHPEWRDTQPFQAVLEGNHETLAAQGERGLIELIMATHAGMSTTEFEQYVSDWVNTARHPRFDRRYTEMVYQPMLELLDYLRANEFTVYIVSGGGIEFMRPWVEAVYGIPPEQVIGSSIETEYVVTAGVPTIERQPEVHFINDKAGKPVGINRFIGRRPILAFGNSDGDYEMLQWTTAGEGPRLGVILHHTDAEREWRYDRNSHIGRLDKGLDHAGANNWLIVDMANDWARVYPLSTVYSKTGVR